MVRTAYPTSIEEAPGAGANSVYNLEVQLNHTYHVGKTGVLVHNGTPCAGAKGIYSDIGGHHIHAKAGFKNSSLYNQRKSFSISQKYMDSRGWNHRRMTNKQRELFKELAQSGRANTLKEHSRIAVEALQAGGATQAEARRLVAESLLNLRAQAVRVPSNIPWH